MHFSIKALIIFIALSGSLFLSFAQENSPGVFKDTVVITDSAKYTQAYRDSLAAQDSLLIMKKKFDQFKYGDVISIANKLLLKKTPFKRADIIDIYELKGISHYSLSEDDAARKSFIEILRIDTAYAFDTTKISPKIITFYNQVKRNYIQQQREIEARTVVRFDTIYVPQTRFDVEHERRLKNAVARSLIIPGLGQWYLETNFKNILFTVLGTASLASSIYYFIKTEKDEKAYLIETNPNEIQSKYDEYNNSFKNRNISLITFGVLWVYSQLDLLFFNDDGSGHTVLKNSSLNYDGRRGVTMNFKYQF